MEGLLGDDGDRSELADARGRRSRRAAARHDAGIGVAGVAPREACGEQRDRRRAQRRAVAGQPARALGAADPRRPEAARRREPAGVGVSLQLHRGPGALVKSSSPPHRTETAFPSRIAGVYVQLAMNRWIALSAPAEALPVTVTSLTF